VQFLFLLCLLRSYDGTDISNFVKLNDFTFPQKLYFVEIVYLLLIFLLKQFIDKPRGVAAQISKDTLIVYTNFIATCGEQS